MILLKSVYRYNKWIYKIYIYLYIYTVFWLLFEANNPPAQTVVLYHTFGSNPCRRQGNPLMTRPRTGSPSLIGIFYVQLHICGCFSLFPSSFPQMYISSRPIECIRHCYICIEICREDHSLFFICPAVRLAVGSGSWKEKEWPENPLSIVHRHLQCYSAFWYALVIAISNI